MTPPDAGNLGPSLAGGHTAKPIIEGVTRAEAGSVPASGINRYLRKQPWCYRGHDIATRRPLCHCGCGRVVMPPRRTTFAIECVRLYHRHNDPATIRRIVGERDKCICALCGTLSYTWEADHIVPVSEGGGGCGPEGYRTLCVPCHRKETAKLAARLAARRREAR